MTLLNIYSLNDTDNQNIIACLPEGKHVIGRGDLLKVTDKRVSRKHAVIEISSDKISLTSVHVNPCFFKAANGKTLSVISQNQQSELNDGDQFALLPESCWFKIKIKKEQDADRPIEGLNNSAAEVNGKRLHENNLEAEDTNLEKRARFSTSHETDKPNNENISPTSNITLDNTNYEENNKAEHSHGKNEVLGEQMEGNETSLNLPQPDVIKTENIENNIESKEEPLNSTSHNLVNNDSNNASNSVDNASTIKPEIKEEPLSNSTNEEIHPPAEGETSVNNIQTENNEQQPEVKTENADDNNQNKGEASGSGTDAKKDRRERCWYGNRCFRKNPNHRESFSHPGDEDYDSDPDDDRPDCPHGINCYRKNPEHRRDYKHVAIPAARPAKPRPKSPNSPTTQQKKPRRAAATKPKPKYDIDSSQDDYDLDDPFINDGSSDDFQPTDDSDSDWEDSQEVDEESQETKRMLKEAKKFTRKGK